LYELSSKSDPSGHNQPPIWETPLAMVVVVNDPASARHAASLSKQTRCIEGSVVACAKPGHPSHSVVPTAAVVVWSQDLKSRFPMPRNPSSIKLRLVAAESHKEVSTTKTEPKHLISTKLGEVISWPLYSALAFVNTSATASHCSTVSVISTSVSPRASPHPIGPSPATINILPTSGSMFFSRDGRLASKFRLPRASLLI